jgi:hypothetical protein
MARCKQAALPLGYTAVKRLGLGLVAARPFSISPFLTLKIKKLADPASLPDQQAS